MADLLTAAQVQNLLNVDRSTVYRMADTGRLPAIKVGRQWRFPTVALDRWLADQGVSFAQSKGATVQTQPPLADELPVSCVQIMQDTFADLLGVMIVVTDMGGHMVTQVSNPCGLFTATLPQAQEICRLHWQRLASSIELEPKLSGSEMGYLCTRGLIRAGNRLRGMVAIGGIAPLHWPPAAEQQRQLAATLGVPVAVVEQHIDDLYYLDSAQQAQVVATVQRIADIVAHMLNERRQSG